MSLAVEADGLVKVFGSVTALDRLSFRVEEGRIYGLILSRVVAFRVPVCQCV